MVDTNTRADSFKRFYDLGYHELIPVSTPDPDFRNSGKRPAVKIDGAWHGRSASSFVGSDAQDRASWTAMGASVGVSCIDTGIVGVDIDTLVPEWASRIEKIAFEEFGVTARRIGRSPKVLVPYRVAVATGYRQIQFDDGRPATKDKKGRKVKKPGLVELIAGAGKFFVGWGIHPDTGKPYEWPDGVWPAEQLPLVTEAQLQRFFERLKKELPKATGTGNTTDGGEVDQDTLVGDPELIQSAMAVIPNPRTNWVKSWCAMAAALRAALPDDQGLGLELFQQWSARLADSEPPEEEAVENVYWSVKPPFSKGAPYIFDLAKAAGWAEAWFDPTPPLEEDKYESIFGEPKQSGLALTPYPNPDPSSLDPDDHIYGTHYVRNFLSTTFGRTKTGKSQLAIAEAVAMVSCKPLLGVLPQRRQNVFIWNGEDPLGHVYKRVEAVKQLYGLDDDDTPPDRLFIDSGRQLRLIVAESKRGRPELNLKVVQEIKEAIIRHRIDVVIVDPFVASHRINENDNIEMEMVVDQWMRIAEECHCAVELVHHTRKLNGEQVTLDSGRGASALLAKARSGRAIARMTRTEARAIGLDDQSASRYFRVVDAESNLVAQAAIDTPWLEKVSVVLPSAANIPVVRVAEDINKLALSVPAERRDALLAVVEAATVPALMYRSDERAARWIGHPMADILGLDTSIKGHRAAIKNWLSELIREGWLKREMLLSEVRQMKEYIVRGERQDVFA